MLASTAAPGTDWTPIAVAIISSLIGPGLIALLTQRLRRENTAQHAENKAALDRIDGKLDRLDTRLDDHGERLSVVEDRMDIARRPRRRRRVRRG